MFVIMNFKTHKHTLHLFSHLSLFCPCITIVNTILSQILTKTKTHLTPGSTITACISSHYTSVVHLVYTASSIENGLLQQSNI